MTHVAAAGEFVAVPAVGVEEPGDDLPLLQPANASTNTSAATHLMPAVCRIRFSFESVQPGSTLAIHRRFLYNGADVALVQRRYASDLACAQRLGAVVARELTSFERGADHGRRH